MANLQQKMLNQIQRNYLSFKLPNLLVPAAATIESLLYDRAARSRVIDKPIFVVGCHRSGTTIFYDTIAQHPDLAYFTHASSFIPETPILTNYLMGLLGSMQQPIERFAQDGLRVSPSTPSEGIRIWERYGTVNGDYCLDETYDNPIMETYLKRTIQKHLKYFDRPRFINKNPDNSVRIRYLNKLFPDAYFIHIVRDGRAVCNSLLKFRKLASEFFGPEHRHATSGVKVKTWGQIVDHWQSEPVLSAGLVWKEVIETLENDRQYISPDRYLEIRYEDFVAQPLEYFQKVAQFCDLRWDGNVQATFQQAATQIDLGGRNDAWKKNLSAGDYDRLMDIIGDKMHQYGYDTFTGTPMPIPA
jgi:omega-hydroxy-beta-dihydromenaquinone-9 sulfotransferase